MYVTPSSPLFQFNPAHLGHSRPLPNRGLLHWNGLDGEPAEQVYLSWQGEPEERVVVGSSYVLPPSVDGALGWRQFANELDLSPEFGDAAPDGAETSVSDSDWSTHFIDVDDHTVAFEIRQRSADTVLGVGLMDKTLITFLARNVPLAQMALQVVTSTESETYSLNPLGNLSNEEINDSLS